MNPRVAVCVVTYNSAQHLDSCLKSLARQTLKPIDVRLWDNASSDATRTVAGRHADLLADIHVSDQNVGFCAAQNRLIASTSSDYVLALNPDVVLEPDFLEILARALDGDVSAGSATGRL